MGNQQHTIGSEQTAKPATHRVGNEDSSDVALRACYSISRGLSKDLRASVKEVIERDGLNRLSWQEMLQVGASILQSIG